MRYYAEYDGDTIIAVGTGFGGTEVNIPRQSRGLFIDGQSPILLATPKRRIYDYHTRKAVYLPPVNGSTSSNVNWLPSSSSLSWLRMYSLIALVFFPTVST